MLYWQILYFWSQLKASVLKNNQKFIFISLVFVGIFSRIIPHIPNVTAVTATALFAGAILSSRVLALAVPVVMMYFSDFFINNTMHRSFFPEKEGLIFWTDYMPWVYLGIIAAVMIGSFALKNRNTKKVIGASLLASFVFFLLSNIGIWLQPEGYPENIAGLASCLTAALPFLRNALIGDLVFAMIIFGIYDLVTKRTSQTQFA